MVWERKELPPHPLPLPTYYSATGKPTWEQKQPRVRSEPKGTWKKSQLWYYDELLDQTVPEVHAIAGFLRYINQ